MLSRGGFGGAVACGGCGGETVECAPLGGDGSEQGDCCGGLGGGDSGESVCLSFFFPRALHISRNR